jgi:hypothetical protein
MMDMIKFLGQRFHFHLQGVRVSWCARLTLKEALRERKYYGLPSHVAQF